jgi:hypothetical protein
MRVMASVKGRGPGMDEAAGKPAASQIGRCKSVAQEISRASTGSDTVRTAI